MAAIPCGPRYLRRGSQACAYYDLRSRITQDRCPLALTQYNVVLEVLSNIPLAPTRRIPGSCQRVTMEALNRVQACPPPWSGAVIKG
jgi:hypothetical protein